MKTKSLLFLFLLSLLFVTCNEDDSASTALSPTLSESVSIPHRNRIWQVFEKSNIIDINGNSSSFFANINSESKNLVLYLEGGGACINALTCTGSSRGIGPSVLKKLEERSIFDFDNPENQFNDWNFVFIPYVSGDVHLGNNPNANTGLFHENQTMLGRNNFRSVLEEVKRFSDAIGGVEEIFFMGTSAGAMGALLNIIELEEAFGDTTKITVFSDSAPIFQTDNLFKPCKDALFRDEIKVVLPEDLDDYVSGTGYFNNYMKVYEYLSNRYPNINFGFASSYSDPVMSLFYGIGQLGCTELPGYSLPNVYKSGILEVQNKRLSQYSNWKVFYKDAFLLHVFQDFFRHEIDGMNLNDWILALRSGNGVDLLE